MKKVVTLSFLLLFIFSFNAFAQDGNNKLFGVPNLSKYKSTVDSSTDGGRSICFIPGPNSLDGDALADIVSVDYIDGGNVCVFEQVALNSLEFKLVWKSKKLKLNAAGAHVRKATSNVTPRTVTWANDLDGNGKKEIVFTQGRAPGDTVLSDTTFPRGIYIYECKGDNDYGTDPYIIPFKAIDTFTNYHNFGRVEAGGIVCTDVDGDGKQELLLGEYDFAFNKDIQKNSSKVYVLHVKSGTFAAKNAVLDTEYVYRGLAKCVGDSDGFVCSGIKVADVDGDGRNEIACVGQRIVGAGGAIGFFKSTAANKYQDGNYVILSDASNHNLFNVTSQIGSYKIDGKDALFINTDESAMGTGQSRLLMISDIIDISLIGSNNINVLKTGNFGGFTGAEAGNQDHGTGTDGYDIYVPGTSKIFDLEYKGTGSVSDSNNYTWYTAFDAKKLYKAANGGIYHIIVPPTDINNNGKKEIISNFQQYGPDTVINGNVPVSLTAPFLVVEWGDTLNGTLGVRAVAPIMEEDYKLEQNYPNPFNPNTKIRFSLPTPENISLIVYDINGKEVNRIIDGKKFEKGTFEADWNGKNQYGNSVASGVYFYKLIWGNFEKSMKMTLLK
jgi:hypothetical protein